MRYKRSPGGRLARLIAVGVTLSVVAAACGDDEDEATPADTSAATTETTASPPTTEPAATPAATTEAATSPPTTHDEAPDDGADYVNDVRDFHMSTVFPHAPSGQIESVFLHTNLAELWGLELDTSRFGSAVEMVNGLAADAIDSYMASDLPVTSAIGKGLDLKVVASSIGWRYGIATKQGSGIETLEDLRGKKVGIHIGNSTQIYLQEALEEAGLIPNEDVEIVNVPTPDMNTALQSGAVDAVGTWDPGLRLLTDAHELFSGQTGAGLDKPAAIIAMRGEQTEGDDREAAVRFMAATIEAIWFAIENPDLTNGWFAAESGLPIDVMEQMLETEPLWQAKSITDIDLRLTQEATDGLTRNVAYFAELGMAPAAIDAGDHVDNSIVEEAMQRIAALEDRELQVTTP